MTCLPETGKDENVLEETTGEPERGADLPAADQETVTDEMYSGNENDERERGRAGRGFGAGFLAGIFTAFLLAGIFLLGWITAQRIGPRQNGQEPDENAGAEVLTDYHTLAKLDEIRNLIEQNYLNDVDGETLSSYLFKGIAVGLEDDYANYYSERELETVLDSSRGEYRGIGTTLEQDVQTREIRVVQVYDGGPAAEAGLQEGDVIRAVDGVSTEGQDLSEVVDQIKSTEETFVMEIFRPETEEELELELKCGDVELTNVEYEMKDGGIGYIRLVEFTRNAVGQFRDALQDLKEQGMEKLIVDLRDNPGGLLDSVCDILDEILPEGLIVYTQDKNGEREEYESAGNPSVDCEIAVLVNGSSASASEIFAGAVQDYGLGPIIGTQTYGKGVVQDTYTLTDGSAFKMTTKKYFTPKGQDIDGSGITPDFVVEEEQEDTVLEKALEVLEQPDRRTGV